MMAEGDALSYCPLPLCLRASSRTWQQTTTVLFQNSAFMSEKTPPFGLKNLFSHELFFSGAKRNGVFPLEMS